MRDARAWHVGVGGFAVGLALAEADPRVVAGAAAAAMLILLALRAAAPGALAAALVLCGAAAGDVRLAAIDAPASRARDGQRVVLRAHLLSMPRPGAFGSSAEVAVAGGPLRGARLLVRAARWAPLPPGIRIGEELRLEGRLKTTAGGRDSAGDAPSFDFAEYLHGRGVAAELLLDDAHRTGDSRGGLAGALDGMRARAERAVIAGMPAGEGALLRGMVLGQDETIEPGLREDFRDSGLAHLLIS